MNYIIIYIIQSLKWALKSNMKDERNTIVDFNTMFGSKLACKKSRWNCRSFYVDLTVSDLTSMTSMDVNLSNWYVRAYGAVKILYLLFLGETVTFTLLKRRCKWYPVLYYW